MRCWLHIALWLSRVSEVRGMRVVSQSWPVAALPMLHSPAVVLAALGPVPNTQCLAFLKYLQTCTLGTVTILYVTP
ncbi:hypothetical protein BJV74DRAFT_598115 [Russula compacta]|nr:hypothetical protein BJV74DRAFT_598115 [Russula compacta]